MLASYLRAPSVPTSLIFFIVEVNFMCLSSSNISVGFLLHLVTMKYSKVLGETCVARVSKHQYCLSAVIDEQWMTEFEMQIPSEPQSTAASTHLCLAAWVISLDFCELIFQRK